MNASVRRSLPLTVGLACAVFERSLRVMPVSLLPASREDLAQLFLALAREAHRGRGKRGVLAVWFFSTLDLLRRLPQERRSRAYERFARPVLPNPSAPRYGSDLMANVLVDLRQVLRGLSKAPGFTIVVILTLALGIGVNSAIFGIVNTVLIRPLGYEQPERLVRFRGTVRGQPTETGTLAYLNLIDIRERSTSFANAAAYDEWRPNLTGLQEPERLDAARVNAEFFDTLGVRPHLGRFFLAAEDIDGNDRVVVLSHGLWNRKFGADRAILGRTIDLNGRAHTVIGVAPADLEDPLLSGGAWQPPVLWRPMGIKGAPEDQQPSRGSHSYTAIGRLREGVTLSEARAEVEALSLTLESEYPDENLGVSHDLVPLREGMVGGARSSLLLMLGAVGFVLAIAVANVANLTLSRATDRGHETALRVALGAGRARLAQLFLLEGLVLAAAGGALGLALSGVLARLMIVAAAGAFPRVEATSIDTSVLAFSATMTAIVGIVCGLAPLAQSRRLDLIGAVKAMGSATTTGNGPRRLRRAFVVAQVALAVILLAGAGLLLRSFWQLTGVDKGIDTTDRLTFSISLPNAGYPELEDQSGFFSSLVSELEELPGVDGAATVTMLPLGGNFDCTTVIATDKPEPPQNEQVCPQFRTVGPSYQRVMGLDLVAGRFLESSDVPGNEFVGVINETLASLLWPGEDVLGKQLRTYREEPIRVVGLVRDVKYRSLDEAPEPGIYVALAQGTIPWQTFRATVVVRAAGDPMLVVDGVRERVRSLDASLPLAGLRTMDSVVSDSVASPRFRTLLLGSFAMLAMTLATVGVYGVISYNVAQQQRDMAIRVALGAARRQVVRQVVGDGLVPVLVGIALGGGGALLAGRLMESMLFQVTTTDPAAFLAVPVILLLTATAAAYLPARRAARVDPMATLRGE